MTIALIVGSSFTNGLRFQLPYNLDAEESATKVEIINAPILDRAPLPPNRRGDGQMALQVAAQKERDDARTGLTYQDYRRWHLPEGAKTRLEKGTISQGDRVIAFSPDGAYIVVASNIGVWLYDVKTTREVALLTGHSDWMHAVVFSPDGPKLASGSEDKTVKLWDVDTKRNITTLEGHTNWVWSVAFSPDGTRLVSGSNNTVELWEVETGKHIDTFRGDGRGLMSVAFSPDGTKLASGSWAGTILVWEMSDFTD